MAYELLGDLKHYGQNPKLSLNSSKLTSSNFYTGFIGRDLVKEDILKFNILSYDFESFGWKKSLAIKSEFNIARAIALEDISNNSLGLLLFWGAVYNSTWNINTGSVVYVSNTTYGGILSSFPTQSQSIIQQIGQLDSPNTIFFHFSPVWMVNM